jgi:hypothetical protein
LRKTCSVGANRRPLRDHRPDGELYQPVQTGRSTFFCPVCQR